MSPCARYYTVVWMRSWHKCIHVLTTLRLGIKGIENSYLLRIYFVAGSGSNPSFHYVPGTRGGLKDFLGVHEIKTFLAIMLRSCWPVFTLFSGVNSMVSQRLHEVWYCNRLNAEANMRIQLPFVKLHIKEIYMQNSATPLCVSFVKVVL